MSDEQFEAFQQKYPNLFKEYPRSGFHLPKGWEKLAHYLCNILERAIDRLPEEVRAGVQCAQVKEKFGGLRFYMTQETPYMSGAIAVVENMSYDVCDVCGEAGKLRHGGWVRALCDAHHEENQKAVREVVKKHAQKSKEKK